MPVKLWRLENLLTSSIELTMCSGFYISFEIDVGTIELPRGGSRLRVTSITGYNNTLLRKRSVGYIDNDDNLCLARSEAYAFAKLNVVSQEEWLRLTENSTLTCLDNILLYQKVPYSFFRHMREKTFQTYA